MPEEHECRGPSLPGRCLILLLGSLCGCYLSTGRSFSLEADAPSIEDAADRDPDWHDPDAVTDPVLDDTIEDMDVEPEPVTCLYEPSGALQVAGQSNDHETIGPRAYWNGETLGVLMFETWPFGPHAYIGLVNVEPDLSSSSTPRLVGEEAHGWAEPAWTGEALGLCWHPDPGMVGRTSFRLVDRDGNALGDRVDIDFDGEACTGLAYGGGRFLMAWRHWASVDDDLQVISRIQLLDGAGSPLGEPVDLVQTDYPGATPALAWTGSEFLVALAMDDIELRWISLEGVVLRREQVDGGPGARYLRMALSEDGSIALAWLTGEYGERGLHFGIYDPGLTPLVSDFVVLPDGSDASLPDIRRAGSGWVIVWQEGPWDDSVAMLLHVDAQGLPEAPRLVLHDGANSSYGGPIAVPVGRELFVAISYPPSPGDSWEQIHVLKFLCAPGSTDICGPQDAAVTVSCDDPATLGWRWTGSTCEELTGCEGDCTGEDCARLSRTEWDCRSDRQLCP